MKKTLIAVLVLLLVTNVFSIYRVIDLGITSTYREAAFEQLESAHHQLLLLSNPLFRGKSSSDLKSLARGLIEEKDIFEKPKGGLSGEDLLVVGYMAFSLDSNGHITKVE